MSEVCFRMTSFHAHLLRLAIWGAVSLVAGLLVLRAPASNRFRRQFGAQATLWGAINVSLALLGRSGVPPTPGFLWLNVGLDAGYAGVGLTMALTGRRFGSPGLAGAGWAVLPQGVVLAILDLIYLAAMGAT